MRDEHKRSLILLQRLDQDIYRNKDQEIEDAVFNTKDSYQGELHDQKEANQIIHKKFIDDEEKMIDFNTITKEQFLNSYSYIC